MEEQKYLIAIAIAEENNKRIMPIGGKTYAGVDPESEVPRKEAEKILLDLLLRLFKRASEGNMKVSNEETGLLLAEISFENMQSKLPIIKSNWINTGNTEDLLKKLNSICSQLWSIQYRKHEGMVFTDLLKNKLP
tara:strand:+ start:1773 stop:2177 length:405 start_codon:yes stop_codon:yes gene_type:complete